MSLVMQHPNSPGVIPVMNIPVDAAVFAVSGLFAPRCQPTLTPAATATPLGILDKKIE